MGYVARAEAIITAKNALRPGLSSAARDLENFGRQQSKSQSLISAGMRRLAFTAAAGVAGVAGYGALKEAAKRFAEVDRAMTRTGITGDATADEVRKGTQALRDMSQETAQKFDPMQKGLDEITASGRDFADAMNMMPSVAKTAMASGAGIDDIAKSSTALIDHMKISIEGLSEAQDALALGGKLGKFELKDMARYLPSMLPAFKALGSTGQEGLRDLVSILQVIRGGTGTAEEAAASAQNIFSKMESDETVKNFKEMGVDLPAGMKKARKEGKNLLDVFVQLSKKALKGDLSKLPQLFSDMEVQRGMRPLIEGFDKVLDYRQKLKNAKGTIDTDFLRVSKDTQATFDRFAEAADRAKTGFGSLVAEVSAPLVKEAAARLNELGQAFERANEAAKQDGFSAAIKRLRDDLQESAQPHAAPPVDDIENATRGRDAATVDRIVARAQDANARPADRYASENLAEEIAQLRDTIALAQPGSIKDRAVERLAVLERKTNRDVTGFDLTEPEIRSVARDQQRRAGLDNIPGVDVSGISKEADGLREQNREAARLKAFRGAGGAPEFPAGGVKTKDGAVLPPIRPSSLKGAIDIPMAPLDEVKTKAEEAKTGIDALGSAGQAAGSQLASGFGGFITEVQRAQSEVDRLAQKLASLKMPSLSIGGAGGLPTGKQGPN